MKKSNINKSEVIKKYFTPGKVFVVTEVFKNQIWDSGRQCRDYYKIFFTISSISEPRHWYNGRLHFIIKILVRENIVTAACKSRILKFLRHKLKVYFASNQSVSVTCQHTGYTPISKFKIPLSVQNELAVKSNILTEV